jgi:aminopeptidase N
VRFYTAQPRSLSTARKQANAKIMDQQQDITEFQSQFNGAYPFTSAGVVIGLPSASFEEEMETMITFEGGRIDLDTLNHENMHQWWGDNVTESNYNMTFFKEGMATLGEYLFAARNAQQAAGGPYTAAGVAAFNASLVSQFNSNYARSGRFWSLAPSNPTPYELFSGSATYDRPGTAYIALRQILGAMNFTRAMQQIQRVYGGRTVTERQLEAAFHQWLPNRSGACQARLDQFFTEWFDTAYPTSGGSTKPDITGPGLDGNGFYNATCIAR